MNLKFLMTILKQYYSSLGEVFNKVLKKTKNLIKLINTTMI